MAPEEARVARALHRYGINREALEACPEIAPIIRRTMGNQKKAMETLRFSEDPDCRKLLAVYYKLSDDDRTNLPLEIPCLAAKVSPAHILGQLVLSARDASRMESALILIGENPEILRASADFGKTLPSATRDREMLLKATGTLPSPKGMSINVFAGHESEGSEEEDESRPEDVFDYDAKTIDGWGDQRRRLMDEDKRK